MLGTGCSYATIGPGQVGVVWTPSGTSTNVLPEGNWVSDSSRPARKGETNDSSYSPQTVFASSSTRRSVTTSCRSQARRVIGRYQPEEIYSTQREVIERQIREEVEKAIVGRHVVLETVLVRNVTLPETIQQAIKEKLQAEQMALKMKFVLEQTEAEAQSA